MSLVSFTIYTVNTRTHAPVANALVFINGAGQGTTNSTGQLTVTVLGNTTIELSAKAAGYNTFTSTAVSTSLPSFTVNLFPSTAAANTSLVVSITPEIPANGVALTFSNNGHPVTQNYAVGGIIVSGLTPGSQTITGFLANYNPINSTFDTTKTSAAVIQLVATTDSGLQQTLTPVPTQDPDSSTLLPPLSQEDIPEFIAPNTGQGTYFTIAQARMYIGNLFINELNSLQFALQDNKIPIYGYASRYLDAKAQGKSLVQGQFSINFISEGYLLLALQAYQQQVNQNALPTNFIANQQQQRLQQLVNQLQNPDPAWTPAMIAAAKSEINSLAASLGPDAVNAAKASMNDIIRQQNNSLLGLPGGDYPNAIYSDIEFDIIIQYTGAGRTLTRRLEQCSLISNESIHDMSGQPILDSYGFIARRLR